MQVVVSGFAVMAGCAIALILLDSAYSAKDKDTQMTGGKLQGEGPQQGGGQNDPVAVVV